ncbi:MAG: hypothetical protein KKB50_05650 [Planctomycetes bacterium]|nr:hypothetical protein [Planctomycetota bacterium]
MTTFEAPSTPLQPTRLGRRRWVRSVTALAHSFRWLTRSRRVLLALAAIWIINLLDLGYTLLESLHSGFIELNPVAARLIGESSAALVGYKMALLLISSTILLICRRHRVAELSCWLLLAVYLYVAICWWCYYEQRLASFDDPAVNVDPLIGCCLPLSG